MLKKFRHWTRKRWYVIETNLFFVSHAVEERILMGPYRYRHQAERTALWHANAALCRGRKVEFLVSRDDEPGMYGIRL